jgi:hypothetical protein
LHCGPVALNCVADVFNPPAGILDFHFGIRSFSFDGETLGPDLSEAEMLALAQRVPLPLKTDTR